MKTNKELELSLIVKESMIQQLKYRLSMYIEKCTMYENSNRDFIERINKSIEYLNDECSYDENLGYCDDLWCGQVQELVNILKGADKE